MTNAITMTPAIARSLADLPCEWKFMGASGKANTSWIEGRFIAMEKDGFKIAVRTKVGESQITLPYPVQLRVLGSKSKEET